MYSAKFESNCTSSISGSGFIIADPSSCISTVSISISGVSIVTPSISMSVFGSPIGFSTAIMLPQIYQY